MPTATRAAKRYKKNVSENNDEDIVKEIEDMANAQTRTNAVSANVAADIEELLNDLDLDTELKASNDDIEEILEGEVIVAGAEDAGEAIEEAVEEPAAEEVEEVSTSSDDELDLDVDELELAMQRDAGYKEQASESSVTSNASEAVEKAKNAAKTEKPAKKPKATASKPRAAKSLADVAPEFFVLEDDIALVSDQELEDNKVKVMATTISQIKVKEKFDNVFTSLARGAMPSVYVVQAFKLLEQKGAVTTADVIAMYKANGLKQGTAQAQTGQIMTLFDILKIATRSKAQLTFNTGSKIAERIRAAIDAYEASKAAPAAA